MTHPPPSSAAEPSAQSREQAGAAFDPRLAPADWLGDKARLAIMYPPARIVDASPAMLALFRVDDADALEARLLRGEGPGARRLRHLASTLPVGQPPRLEGMRFVVERRPMNVNLRCARVPAPGGASWLLVSIPALGAGSVEPPPLADDRAPPELEEPAAPNVSGPLPHFVETFPDDGYMDMYQVMKAFRKVKCTASLIPDHYPQLVNDPGHRIADTYSITYMRALLRRANEEVG